MKKQSAGICIWGTAVVLSLAFADWYHNTRKPASRQTRLNY